MVISCAAYGCKNRYYRESHVKFHRFPMSKKYLLNQWILAIKRKDFTPTKHSYLCSNHFSDDDYIKIGNIKKWRLKRDAVPTCFDFPPDLQEAFNVLPTIKNRKTRQNYPVINRKNSSVQKKQRKQEEIDSNVIDFVVSTYNEVAENRAEQKKFALPHHKKEHKTNEIRNIVGRNTVLLQYVSDKLVKVDENLEVMNDFSSNVQWIEEVYNNMNIISLIDECDKTLKKLKR